MLTRKDDPVPRPVRLVDDRRRAFTSAASKAVESRFENGRRYHAYDDGSAYPHTSTPPTTTTSLTPNPQTPAYNLPNDELEQERLDLQHIMWLMTHHNALHLSPISPQHTHRVLDVGTGTGAWAIAFAERHPSARVVGTDLSPVQPAFAPANCEFLVDNAERDWAFFDEYDRGGSKKKFDFVHARMLCMGVHDWPRFLRQCWDNLAPGGWLELREITFPWATVDDDDDDGGGGGAGNDSSSALLRWSEDVRRGAARAGIDTTACRVFDTHLRALGFVDIRKERPAWPLGEWPRGRREKLLGRYALRNLETGLEAISTAVFSRYLGMSRESIELSLMEARRDLHDPTMHHYAPL
ncbi:hypothetical protein SLS55_001413 [Diplodia seriata]|uniref:Methyltransferase domain-containing protein n=1 Tax=Diplodia seriata TaxID=420778 RepID=A0ABR3CPA2_9PEZI